MSVGFAEDKGLSTVKLDQQLLTRSVSAGTLRCTHSLYGAEVNRDSCEICKRIRSSASHKRRGWLSLQTTCCLSELTWRLPPTDDEEEAAWLEGSQKAQKDTRRKGRLSETAGLDRAFIQQHLLHHCCLCRDALNRPTDSRDTHRKTSLFFMAQSMNLFKQQQLCVTTFTFKTVWNDFKVALRVNGATLYSEGREGIKKQAGGKSPHFRSLNLRPDLPQKLDSVYSKSLSMLHTECFCTVWQRLKHCSAMQSGGGYDRRLLPRSAAIQNGSKHLRHRLFEAYWGLSG